MVGIGSMSAWALMAMGRVRSLLLVGLGLHLVLGMGGLCAMRALAVQLVGHSSSWAPACWSFRPSPPPSCSCRWFLLAFLLLGGTAVLVSGRRRGMELAVLLGLPGLAIQHRPRSLSGARLAVVAWGTGAACVRERGRVD